MPSAEELKRLEKKQAAADKKAAAAAEVEDAKEAAPCQKCVEREVSDKARAEQAQQEGKAIGTVGDLVIKEVSASPITAVSSEAQKSEQTASLEQQIDTISTAATASDQSKPEGQVESKHQEASAEAKTADASIEVSKDTSEVITATATV